MRPPNPEDLAGTIGRGEIAAGLAPMRGAMAVAFLFSAFVNLLMLSAPLYMLQVYDRVIVSRSVETLLALTLLLAGLFLIQGVLDYARGRIMARVAANLQAGLEGRVIRAAICRTSLRPQDASALAAERDLDALARFWASPALLALFDLPWTPLFFAALWIIHPWLGAFAVGGAAVLVFANWANRRATDPSLNAATLAGQAADSLSIAMKSEAELLRALGMTGPAQHLWQEQRDKARAESLVATDSSGRWSAAIRTFRLFLQSAMLGLAAWLALQDAIPPSVLAVTSILMGRALLPLEQTVTQWHGIARARLGHARLTALLGAEPPLPPRLNLPRPAARLEVKGLTVVPPGGGQPVLRGVSFSLMPGQVMGVIGGSGSGKSTLARALAGIWQPTSGQVRLDGTTFDQYDADRLGSWIGYLPQRVSLLEGTVAANIARLRHGVDAQDIIAAARAAAAHEMILRLPGGYDCRLAAGAGSLSGGQIQRIGLARAIFGDPVLLILDEPNANLDHEGEDALNQAIRAARSIGSAVLVMAHRPAALKECDILLVLKDGAVAALGPRDQVLRDVVKNASEVVRTFDRGQGG